MARALLKVLDGGITDFPYSSPDNIMVTCDNLLSKVNNGLMTRPGCQKYAGRTSAFTSSRIDYLTTSGSDIFFKSGRDLIVGSANGSTTILYTGGHVGSQLITNYTFSASATGWTVAGSGWTFDGNNAIATEIDNDGLISQTIVTTPGKKYSVMICTTGSTNMDADNGGSAYSIIGSQVWFSVNIDTLLFDNDKIGFYNPSTITSSPADLRLWTVKTNATNNSIYITDADFLTPGSAYYLNNKIYKEQYFKWGSSKKGLRVNFGTGLPLAPANYIDLNRDNEITYNIPFNYNTYGMSNDRFCKSVFEATGSTTTISIGYAYQYDVYPYLKKPSFQLQYVSVKEILDNGINCFGSSTTSIDSTKYSNQILFSDDTSGKPITVRKTKNGNYEAVGAGAPSFVKRTTSSIAEVTYQDICRYRALNPVYADETVKYIYYFVAACVDTAYDESGNETIVETVSAPVVYPVGLQANTFYNLDQYIEFAINGISSTSKYNKFNTFLRIYRTPLSGSVAYLLDEVSLGHNLLNSASATYYADNTLTFGNILSSNPVLDVTNTTLTAIPNCKSLVTIRDITYAAPSFDDTELNKEAENISNRVRESEAGTLTSFPQDYYTDVQYNVVGVGKAQENLIILSEREIYRQSGNNNSSNPRTDVIHSYAGCLSNNSIVHGKEKLYWAGKDGFYVTNGYETSKLPKSDTLRINDTYKTITGNTNNTARNDRIYGGYDYRNNLVYWCVDSVGSASTDNNKIFVYDEDTDGFMVLYGSQTSQMGAWSTAIDFNDTGLIRATGSGYIMQHVDSLTSDQVYSGSWTTLPISSKLRHIAFDFQDQTLMKYVNSVTINARNTGSQTISIKTYDDGDTTGQTLQAIVATGSETKRLVKTRRMNGSGIRCFTKELEISSDQNVLDIDSFSYDYVVEDKQSTYYNKDSET